MNLVVFDLDGTLLNKRAEISPFTRDTLNLMRKKGIAYTVATGRTLHSAHDIIAEHGFIKPHIYSNGVTLWDPDAEKLSLNHPLSNSEVSAILKAGETHQITPFVSVVDDENNQHFIFHDQPCTSAEEDLLKHYRMRKTAEVYPISEMPDNPTITNISFLALHASINAVKASIADNPQLIAYTGVALEGDELSWMDIHHREANKGTAVGQLSRHLGASRVICFGDNDNDLSMINIADESYAPSNAIDTVKQAVDSVIGHHNEDGVAHFLRERFSL